MAQQVNINDLTHDMEAWRVTVVVLEKSNVYTNESGRRIQKLILQDKQGTKVEGVIWNHNINLLQGSLRPFSTYILREARIEPIRAGHPYSIPGITDQWVLSRDTFISLVKESIEQLPYPALHLPGFGDIKQLANTGSSIDVVAIVIAVQEPKHRDVKGRLTPLRECTLIQNE